MLAAVVVLVVLTVVTLIAGIVTNALAFINVSIVCCFLAAVALVIYYRRHRPWGDH